MYICMYVMYVYRAGRIVDSSMSDTSTSPHALPRDDWVTLMARMIVNALDDTNQAVSQLQHTISEIQGLINDQPEPVDPAEFDEFISQFEDWQSKLRDVVSFILALKILAMCLRCRCVCFQVRSVVVLTQASDVSTHDKECQDQMQTLRDDAHDIREMFVQIDSLQGLFADLVEEERLCQHDDVEIAIDQYMQDINLETAIEQCIQARLQDVNHQVAEV